MLEADYNANKVVVSGYVQSLLNTTQLMKDLKGYASPKKG